MMSAIRAVGVSWYSEKDYQRARAIMSDMHRLPATHAEWLGKAEAQERELSKRVTVVRVTIEPDQFLVWCEQNQFRPDAKARSTFAAETVMRRIEQPSSKTLRLDENDYR